MNLESYSFPEAKYAKFALETDKPFEMYMGNSPEGTIARDYNGEHHEELKRIWNDSIAPFARKASYRALRSDLAKAMCTPLPKPKPKPKPKRKPTGKRNGYISDDGFVFDGEETPVELSSESEAVSTDEESDEEVILAPEPPRKKRKKRKKTKKLESIDKTTLEAIRKIVGFDISMQDALKLQHI